MNSRGVKLVRYTDDNCGACQEQVCSRAPVGILPEVSGRQAETENEHRKEQGDQYLRAEEISFLDSVWARREAASTSVYTESLWTKQRSITNERLAAGLPQRLL